MKMNVEWRHWRLQGHGPPPERARDVFFRAKLYARTGLKTASKTALDLALMIRRAEKIRESVY